MTLTDSFENFLTELKQKVEVAKATGMSASEIANQATRVGDWLAKNYDPKSPEQRLLKEMWDVSNESEHKAIASALYKLVEKKVPATR
ncbi:MAG: DUF3243 family protein [Clostridia bacterium]|nr:DUF3243 family protein [Clostridia bacterium]